MMLTIFLIVVVVALAAAVLLQGRLLRELKALVVLEMQTRDRADQAVRRLVTAQGRRLKDHVRAGGA